MAYNFLLIGNPADAWRRRLQDAIAPLGDLHSFTEKEARVRRGGGTHYDVVVVDATEVERVEEAVTQFSSQLNPPYIIVMASDLSWQDAHRAFQAGASDYIRKYGEKDKLARFFTDFLTNPATGGGGRRPGGK
jgi:DNA-binding NarL/FixJ family response regulator